MIGASWRVYRAGFGRFFALALLVSTPSFFLQLAAPFLELPANNGPLTPVIVSVLVAFAMLMLLIIAWPFSLAGMQLLSADLLAGRNPTLRDLLTRAKPLWTRMFVLGLIVYGSYLLWTVLPLLLAASLATAATAGALLFVLLLLIFTTYMVARLFINFLFWQPAGALGGGDAMDALRESKELARSGNERPRMERPLYRGAIIASVWLLVIIVLNIGIELPAMLWRLRGVTSVEQGSPADPGDGDQQLARPSLWPNDSLQLARERALARLARRSFRRALLRHEGGRAEIRLVQLEGCAWRPA